MRILRVVLVAVSVLCGLVLLLVSGFILTEWWPPAEQLLEAQGGVTGPLPADLRIVTWNLGYAAMDEQTDFFMDGGQMSRGRSAQAVRANLDAIVSYLRERRADALLLQEVDASAARSFGIDERALLGEGLSGYDRVYALNYKVPFVPVPYSHPMGGVRSGLLTLVRGAVGEARSYALPGRQKWPNRLFNLKRTLTVLHLAASGGKKLVLVNAHLTAFDSVGNLRQQEAAFVRERILAEYAGGSAVIVGGDWNSSMPGMPPPPCGPEKDDRSWLIDLPAELTPPGWTWAVGKEGPSVRTLGAPRNPRTTCYAAIDGFLLSPGVELVGVQTQDLGFAHSDHNPVELRVRLH